MKRIFLSLIFIAMAATVALAQSPREELLMNPRLSLGNLMAYPYNDGNLPALTASPAGYEAFYIDHYGRHGSRWLGNPEEYKAPVVMLEKAQKAGKLTDRGERLLMTLRRVLVASDQRIGELSDIGAEQHQDIARRMVEHFPSVFKDGALIDAKSSISIRCILSMMNETNTFKAMCPNVKVITDASNHDKYYIAAAGGYDTIANNLKDKMSKVFSTIAKEVDPTAFYGRIFNDVQWAKDSLDTPSADGKTVYKGKNFMLTVFRVGGAMQNHHLFDDVEIFSYFSDDEIYQLWHNTNLYYYLRYCNAPANGHRLPYAEHDMLVKFLEAADNFLASGKNGATLHFGHDTILLPFSCLLELGNCNASIDDLSTLDEQWQSYKIFPMAGNLQIIFYHRIGAKTNNPEDVLVKALLNEHEVSLPTKTDHYPYYKWSEVRAYWQKKANTEINWK